MFTGKTNVGRFISNDNTTRKQGGYMALFQKKIGTVFLKEESDATGFINRMVQLEEQVADKYLKNEI